MLKLTPRPKRLIRGLRWWIIAVCFLSTMVNYIDRQCLSVAAPTVCHEFGFSNADYATIVMAFMAAYALMQCVSGAIVDRIGVRLGMALFAAWWSVAGMLHALCGGLWSFRTCRFLLGMGEAGNWPSATKVVSEWFPARERSIAVAIFDSGSGIGGLVAVPLVALLVAYSGWRFAFLATGALVIPWIILWLWIYRPPEEHDRITDAEWELVLRQPPAAARQGPAVRAVVSATAFSSGVGHRPRPIADRLHLVVLRLLVGKVSHRPVSIQLGRHRRVRMDSVSGGGFRQPGRRRAFLLSAPPRLDAQCGAKGRADPQRHRNAGQRARRAHVPCGPVYCSGHRRHLFVFRVGNDHAHVTDGLVSSASDGHRVGHVGDGGG